MDGLSDITGLKLFQLPTMIFILGIIVLEFLRYKNEKQRPWHSFMILFWMFHSMVFYIVLFLYTIHVVHIENQTLLFTNWSSGLRFHGFLTFFTLKLNKQLLWKLKKE